MDLVSVIIPLSNKADYIAETLASINAQTWPNIEVIVVENNSSDNSYEVAKKHAGRNVKVFRTKKKSASAARNVGLRVAKGDFVQFLDADDLLSPTKIESQINALAQNHQLAICNWARFTREFDQTNAFINEIPEHSELVYTPKEFLETQYTAPIHTWLCSSRLIKRVGFWDETLTVNDDGDYFIRLVNECDRILFVPDLVYYRSDPAFSLSQQKDAKSYESKYATYLTYQNVVSRFNSEKLNIAAKHKFANLFLEAHNKNRKIATLCEEQINFDYTVCFCSLRKTSQFIALLLGVKSYLKLKSLIRR